MPEGRAAIELILGFINLQRKKRPVRFATVGGKSNGIFEVCLKMAQINMILTNGFDPDSRYIKKAKYFGGTRP